MHVFALVTLALQSGLCPQSPPTPVTLTLLKLQGQLYLYRPSSESAWRLATRLWPRLTQPGCTSAEGMSHWPLPRPLAHGSWNLVIS